jgi:hypothetical protein
MITVKYNGRLGNQIFQYLAASIFSIKHNLYLEFNEKLNPILTHISGDNYFTNSIVEINDNNFLDYLNRDNIEPCHYIFNGFFQLKDFITNYENEILIRYKHLSDDKKNGFVIHLRMGDVVNYVGNLDYDYYRKCIESINQKGYIVTDDPNSNLIEKLINNFDLELYNENEYDDFIFATKFNNIILSQGTYSFWIGFFSQSKNIYYNSRPPIWHGDIFLHDKWLDMYKK